MPFNLNKVNTENFGSFCFKLSIFLLPSAFGISIIFILISLITRIIESGFKEIIKNKWNISLLAALFFMIFSCISSQRLLLDLEFYNIPSSYFKNWSPSYSWIGLFNWAPFFLIFIYFQKYLSSPEERKKVGKLLILGTIPVFISGFLQTWFGVYGPYEILNGLVIWYQREIYEEKLPVFTAMFNNQNYAGAWLNIIWPFTLAILTNSYSEKIKRYILFFLCILFTLATYTTYSRNAYLGYLISISSFSNLRPISIITIILISSILIIPLLVFSNLNPGLYNFLKLFIHPRFLNASNFFTFFLDSPRINIWFKSIKYILMRPFWGWGAASFPIIYEFESRNELNPQFQSHTHNIFLSLALNYGIIVSLIILFFLVSIQIEAFFKYREKVKIFKNIKNYLNFDKAWMISFVILFISQLFDIQYYDGRISIALWILLAGLKSF